MVLIDGLAQFIRGFFMGAADIVPGVSGGTVALVFGIYERFLNAIRTGAHALGNLAKGNPAGFIAKLKEVDWAFLLPLVAGVVIAFGGLSGIIEELLHDHPEAMAGLFFGLVLGSIWVAWKLLSDRDAVRLSLIVGVGALMFFVLGFSSGPVADPPLLAYFGAGAVAICAMILPGISGSFLLLMMGMYAALLGAVHDRDLLPLIIFMVGATIGLAIFSTFLGKLLDRHHDTVIAVLIGLMVGSLRVLWPWPNGVGSVTEIETEAGSEEAGSGAAEGALEIERVSGTGLDWPTADTALVPIVLAVVATIVVIGVSEFAGRRTSAH